MIAPVRFSHLRAYGKSAMHGKHARERDSEQTTAMQRGSAVHALVFATKKVVGYPGAQRRGKEYEAFAQQHADAEILTMAEYDKALRMAGAVVDSTLAAPLLKGTTETTIRFEWMGLQCRVTPDVRGASWLTELKSSATADPMRFPWVALRHHYHAQMRFQQIACGMQPQDCYIVCVESEEPFPVSVFRIDEKALVLGEKLLVSWAERLKNSEQSDLYPPYATCIMPIDAPDDLNLEYGDA